MAIEEFTQKQIKTAIMDLRGQVPKEEKEVAGIKVWVHGLTSYELEEWRLVKNNPEVVDTRLSTAKLLQLSLRDKTGIRIFSDKELAIIGGLPAKHLEPLSRVVLKLSGFGVEAEEDILKNLLKIAGAAGLSEQPENTNAASPSSLEDTPDGS